MRAPGREMPTGQEKRPLQERLKLACLGSPVYKDKDSGAWQWEFPMRSKIF